MKRRRRGKRCNRVSLLALYVLLVAGYFAVEFGSAFLPGHAVDRIKADPHHCVAIGDPADEAVCWATTRNEAR
jgi:hypothetical protein